MLDRITALVSPAGTVDADSDPGPQDSLATRFASRNWWSIRDDIPSWTMSLVTHMAVLVIISAIASPYQRSIRSNSRMISIAGWEEDDETNRALTEMMPRMASPQNENVKPKAVAESAPPSTHSAPNGQNDNSERANESPTAVKETDQWKMNKPIVLNSSKTDPVPIDRKSRTGIDRKAKPRVRPFQYTSRHRHVHDQIVERFIRMDIGQIVGTDAVQARKDFHRLGPDAIPALVRGLNIAAGIRASCPVGVLSSRIKSLLRKTPDRTLIRYAVENIGKGVSSDQPHYGRIAGMSRDLKNMYGQIKSGRRERTSSSEWSVWDKSPIVEMESARPSPRGSRRSKRGDGRSRLILDPWRAKQNTIR